MQPRVIRVPRVGEERLSEATLALAPCCCFLEMDLGTEAGVGGVCRVGVDTAFFSMWERNLTCKVNSRRALIGGSVTGGKACTFSGSMSLKFISTALSH